MIQVTVLDDYMQVKILSPVTGNFRKDVEFIKALPGRSYRDGFWYVPYEQKYNLIDIFGDDNIDWTNEDVPDKVQPMASLAQITIDMKVDQFKLAPFPYQIVGASFLVSNEVGILADQPGIGKTLQAIMAADYLFRKGELRKVLVIAPSAVKYQWAGEIEKFTDYTYSVIDGVPKKRKEQLDADVNFYLINYELIRQDFDLALLKQMDFDAIILDEAHRIKDYNNQTSTKVRQLNAPYKWLLTGTPMQNKPDELYSLFAFMDEDILGKITAFKQQYLILGKKYGRYGVVLGYKNQARFRNIIAPYIMRRTVEEVLPQMPPLTVTNLPVELTKEQLHLHDLIEADMIRHWENLKKINDPVQRKVAEDQMLGFRILQQEVCDSLDLLNMSESKMAARYKVPSNARSPKLNVLNDIIEERLSNDPQGKIVVFTQFERMQRIIVDSLKQYGTSVVINGSMKALHKQVARDKFKYDKDIRFLVCTDAAKEGLNLQEASLLVNVDIPWNPAILTQRIGRIRRADSKHDHLQVINLIGLHGIDERILEVNYDKKNMSDYLVEKDESDRRRIANLTDKVMSQIIRDTKRRKKNDI